MNLSDIIHSSQERPRRGSNSYRTQHRFSDPYPRRLHDYRQEDMAAALTATAYQNRSPLYARPPHPPPSPPLDDVQGLRTLPSIQSLINMDKSSASLDNGSKWMRGSAL